MKNKTKVRVACLAGFLLSFLMLLVLVGFYFSLMEKESVFTPRDYGQLEFNEENYQVMQEVAQLSHDGSIEIHEGTLKLIRPFFVCLVLILAFFTWIFIHAGRFHENQVNRKNE